MPFLFTFKESLSGARPPDFARRPHRLCPRATSSKVPITLCRAQKKQKKARLIQVSRLAKAREFNAGFGNEANARTKSGSAAPSERHMGERRRRLTLPKQRRVGIVRLPLTFPSLISRWDQLRSGAPRENGPRTRGRAGAAISSDVMGEHYIRSPVTKCSRQHWFQRPPLTLRAALCWRA